MCSGADCVETLLPPQMYVLFQHLMITHDGKGILAPFPGYYSINLLTSLVVWWFCALCVSTAARTVSTYSKPIIQDDEEELQA